VPQENNVQDESEDEQQHGDDPNEQGESHGGENYRLCPMLVAQKLQVIEELVEARTVRLAFARIDQRSLADRVKCESIYDLAWSLSSQEANGAYNMLTLFII
jgi:hypothetical protein